MEAYGVSAATIDSLAGVTTLQDMNLTLREGVRGEGLCERQTGSCEAAT